MALTPARVVARLLANVEQAGGCVVTLYSVGSHGYGQIGWHENGRRVMAIAHRVAWEAVHGPIPNGLTVDHICRNRRCINAGHPYDDENTYIHPATGHRRCRACAIDRRVAA